MKKINSRKIRLSTITIIAISVAVISAVLLCVTPFLNVYTGTVRNDAAVALEQSVSQTRLSVQNFVDGMKERLINICDEISDSGDLEKVGERLSVAVRLEGSIESICVYDRGGRLLVCSSNGRELKGSGVNLSYDPELFAASEDFAISLPHVQTLFREYYPWVVTIVHREENSPLGPEVYVAIDFSFADIAEYVDNVGVGIHGYCYIIDNEGNIVYHPRQQMIFSGLIEEGYTDIMQGEDRISFDGNVIRAVSSLDDSGWRVVGVSYLDELTSTRDAQINRVTVTTLICCTAVAVLIGVIFSQIVSKPVLSLVDSMEKFESQGDNFRYSPPVNHIAELQTLSDSFGHMAWMVRALMDKIRGEEITLRKTELKALQAQINPHFLYNTLDSIQWMCERGNTESAINMVSALGRLFRISISRGHELIPIRDELKHAESYLIIQKYRYSDRFSYRFDVDESLGDCLCNKITLQPLVENAIYHGIEPLIDEGEIIISVKSDGGDILMKVEDNGVGMTAEQCESLLKKERSDSSGIGIKNGNDRIRIYFGEGYGVTVDSELDRGTTITVRIPNMTKEPENEV